MVPSTLFVDAGDLTTTSDRPIHELDMLSWVGQISFTLHPHYYSNFVLLPRKYRLEVQQVKDTLL